MSNTIYGINGPVVTLLGETGLSMMETVLVGEDRLVGEVIGINTETLDDNADAIATAKQILQTKGASYRNITFASGSEAGQFALNIMSFPTTYVIDRNGKIVGEPVLGGITNENSMKQLQENIDTAIANDGK